MKLAIPGIPFPLGSDFTGDQRHDTGAHLTFWSQPGSAGNGSPYTPPDLTTALQIEGQEFTFTLLPPEEGLKILVASESNDMKTGVCYYLSMSFDDISTKIANDIKLSVGLQADLTQNFHLTVAGIAPSWQAVHPKSLVYRRANKRQRESMNPEEDFEVFRHGFKRWKTEEGMSFVGFNADAVTSWSTHASQAAAMGQENVRISKAVEELAKKPQSEERDVKMAKLKSEKKAIINKIQMLGYPKAISKGDAEMLKSVLPENAAQVDIVTAFAAKRLKVEATMK